MTRRIELADGTSSASAPTTTPIPTTGEEVELDPTGTDYTATNAQELLTQSDSRLSFLENANYDDFRGYWNANTNNPALTNGGGSGLTPAIVEGNYLVVSVAGSTALDGVTEWAVGDQIFFDGTVWKKRDNSEAVTSVNAMSGAVVLDADDIAETATRYWSKKNNLTAATAPTTGDDSGDGYSVGSLWYNSSTNFLYVLEDATPSAAVWVSVSGGGGGAGSYAVVRDEKASGTNGGDFTSGSFQTRVLNTLVDPDGIASLSSNQFTLQAGTYLIDASLPAYSVGTHKSLLYNVTAAANAVIGSSEYADVPSNNHGHSFIKGIFVIAVASAFEIRHRCTNTVNAVGFGLPASFGVNEVYTQAIITKLA